MQLVKEEIYTSLRAFIGARLWCQTSNQVYSLTYDQTIEPILKRINGVVKWN